MSKVFKTILLLALPASGKSEVRNFMSNIEAERLKEDFHIGENLQLDDFPYVHFMRRIDEELGDMGEERIFYPTNDDPFLDNRDWGTLICLLNQDYRNMMDRTVLNTESYSMNLFARIDGAASQVGIEPRIANLSEETILELSERLEEEAKEIVLNLENQYPEDFQDKTLIIECARGGPDGSEMPLTGGYGYQFSLPLFSDEILEDASILYIWVTPEESRRKNQERANPDDPGSNLFHGVPIRVMLGDYGCDDMSYLRETSEVKDTITVKKENKTYHVPIGVFDNRVDKTSFLRKEKSLWTQEEIAEMTKGIANATDTMWRNYKG